MARTHPVDVIRRRVQAAATPEEEATARPQRLFHSLFLILPPHYFRSHLLISSSSRCRSAHRCPRSARVGAHTRKGPNPYSGPGPSVQLVWQFVVGDVVRPRRPGPDDFGFITIVAVPGLDMGKDFGSR